MKISLSNIKRIFFNKIILFNYIFLFTIFIIYGYMRQDFNYSYIQTLGLDISTTSNYVEISMYYYNILFTVLITVLFFIKDYNFSMNNLFLRMRKEQWIFNTVIKIMIILMIIKTTNHFLIFLPIQYKMSLIIINFIKDIIFTFGISLSSLLFLIISKKAYYYIIFFMILMFLKINILNINYILAIMLVLFEFLIIILYFTKKSVKIFERINGGKI